MVDNPLLSLHENYFKLHRLINDDAAQKFREIFASLWHDAGRSPWKNAPSFGHQFVQTMGSGLYKRSQKIQRKFLDSGNINMWDLLLLMDSIKAIHEYTKAIHPHQGDFEKLREIRNELSHLGNTQLDDQTFQAHWTSAIQILSKYGLKEDDLSSTTIKLSGSEVESGMLAKVMQLKDEGNTCFGQGNFWKAIKLYTEAIEVENIDSKSLSILYSNRSAGFCQVKFYSEAKTDAKCCINLQPQWGKGYYRLGLCYEKLNKFQQALLNYEISLKYDPAYQTCLFAKNYCIHMIAKQKREEHLDPTKLPPTVAEMEDRTSRLGFGNIPFRNEMQKALCRAGATTFICQEAHKYAKGAKDYPQNYKKAAKLFSKAASQGNAEGMYNLGLLTAEDLHIS